MTITGMIKPVILTALLATTLACAGGSGTGPTEPTPAPAPDSGFGSEGTDPGMGDSGAGGAGMDAGGSEFSPVYFQFDDHSLRTEARAALKHNADVLGRNAAWRVTVQGNCDERGSAEYNLALGQKRADAARRYLVDLGVNASRIDTVSFGEEKPAVRGHNETAWAKNRRDDFVAR